VVNTIQAQTDPTKVMGRRIGAWVVDVLIISVVFFALVAATVNSTRISYNPCVNPTTDFQFCTLDNGREVAVWNGTDTTVYRTGQGRAAELVALLVAIAIGVFMQGLTGYTPGKALFSIRTVDEQGQVPGIGKAFIRWILWIVDAFPYCCVVPLTGGIVAFSSKGHRRVGDMGAKTFVVDRSAMGQPIVVPGLTAPYVPPAPPWAPPADQWGAGGGAIGGAVSTGPQQSGWAAPPVAPGTAPAPQTEPTQPLAPTPAEEPTDQQSGPPAADEPQWDPQRNAYILWNSTLQKWTQYDSEAGEWKPID
jgi:uncharacterized RDD family membrane protein YckC